MVFSGIPFLYYFLPLVILVYFLSPGKLKNSVLFVFSLGFYAWGEPKYVFLMLLAIGVNYILGILTERYRGERLSKVFLTLSVVFCLGNLGYFKYADFFIRNTNALFGTGFSLLKIALPIGISFYTFQTMSYVVDVYRGKVNAQKNFINLGTYVAFFPQLIAGPIVRYKDIAAYLENRTHTPAKISCGISRFVTGLAKKVILANTLGELCAGLGAGRDGSVLLWWLYAVAYMLQVYFDFSGYSDMAIGLGKIFGFDFLENFRYPLASTSIADFWRRWHISLGSWFRDYVYIPLGGNRCKPARHIFNILVVWILTGFWHGAEWNFIVWGLYFAVLLVAEKLILAGRTPSGKAWSRVYVLFFVTISFGIFSATSLESTARILGGMFGLGGIPFVSDSLLYTLRNYGVTLAVSVLCATPVLRTVKTRLNKSPGFARAFDILEIPVLAILLLVSTAYLADGSFNPFLYFRF